MKAPRRIPSLLLVLAVLALTAACSEGNDMLNPDANVRVVLTGDGNTAAAAASDSGSPTAPGSAGATDPSAALGRHDDDDDDDDGQNGDDILSRLAEANVTFASLHAKNVDGSGLIDLALDLPFTVNLVDVMEGGEVTLPMGTLPPGMYNQLVVVITEVEFVFLNGGKIALTPPGGGWTRVMDVTPFEVVEGTTTTIELQFRPRAAFRELNGQFQFFPNFGCRTR